MVPISNKWVLTKKRDKEGNIIKFKACLVAHSFIQCPGLDYDETYSPIVHFEIIQALLAMVASKRLKVQQLDVKGAYLNGILTQPIQYICNNQLGLRMDPGSYACLSRAYMD